MRSARLAPLEDRVVHDLVQQDREVEDREPLHERERDPDQRILEADQSPGRQAEDRELPGRNQQVAGGDFRWSAASARAKSPRRAPPAALPRAANNGGLSPGCDRLYGYSSGGTSGAVLPTRVSATPSSTAAAPPASGRHPLPQEHHRGQHRHDRDEVRVDRRAGAADLADGDVPDRVGDAERKQRRVDQRDPGPAR